MAERGSERVLGETLIVGHCKDFFLAEEKTLCDWRCKREE